MTHVGVGDLYRGKLVQKGGILDLFPVPSGQVFRNFGFSKVRIFDQVRVWKPQFVHGETDSGLAFAWNGHTNALFQKRTFSNMHLFQQIVNLGALSVSDWSQVWTSLKFRRFATRPQLTFFRVNPGKGFRWASEKEHFLKTHVFPPCDETAETGETKHQCLQSPRNYLSFGRWLSTNGLQVVEKHVLKVEKKHDKTQKVGTCPKFL